MAPGMTIEERMQAGDFEGALAMLTEQNATGKADPGQVLMEFNLQVRLQRFDAAAKSIRRVMELAPHVANNMKELEELARAEQLATERLTNPAVAGKRSGIGIPPPFAMAYVKAAVQHAQKDHAGAAATLEEAKAATPKTAGTLTWRNGQTAKFIDICDSDDLTGPILPCYDGATVVDLPYSQLQSVTFGDSKTSFDVIWLPAEIVPVTGKPFFARVPALHLGAGVAQMSNIRLGQMTLWDRSAGYAQASGQRDIKFWKPGMSMVGILQIRRIALDNAPVQTAPVPEKKGFWKKLLS